MRIAGGCGVGGAITPTDALCVRNGVFVNQSGRRVALYGVNLYQSHMQWPRRQDAQDYEKALTGIAALGFNTARMPLNMALFQPRQGVFPDSPQYAEVLAAHNLPTGTMAFYDGLVKKAGESGVYIIPEFHELPVDPYRWFVGGNDEDRNAGRPGTAIAWMAKTNALGKYETDWELARREVPRTLGWLAAYWKGVANIAGIEVPWNEPGGPLTEAKAYYALCQDCGRAVKGADPRRLVFMDVVDWGAMVNSMPNESLWALPKEADALFPHFYPGLHSGDSGQEGTWSASMANWVSWMGGARKPVMVGEFVVIEMHRAPYWEKGTTDKQRAKSWAACLTQWYAMGVDGAFCWAWDDGTAADQDSNLLNKGMAVLGQWPRAYLSSARALGQAQLAVVCAPLSRAQYGSRTDLWAITQALLDAHLAPFAAVFTSQVAAQPDALRPYKAAIVLNADITGAVSNRLAESGVPLAWVKADRSDLAEAIAAVKKHVAPAGNWPANVIVGYAPREAIVFERGGKDGSVNLRLTIPTAGGEGRLVTPEGRELFAGRAVDLSEKGVDLPLRAWECLSLVWEADPARTNAVER